MDSRPYVSASAAPALDVPASDLPTSDVYPDRKFVRVTEERADGFIAFDFAISEPDLFVELLLTRPAFEEFCRAQNAIFLDDAPNSAPDALWRWRLGDAANAGFKF